MTPHPIATLTRRVTLGQTLTGTLPPWSVLVLRLAVPDAIAVPVLVDSPDPLLRFEVEAPWGATLFERDHVAFFEARVGGDYLIKVSRDDKRVGGGYEVGVRGR